MKPLFTGAVAAVLLLHCATAEMPLAGDSNSSARELGRELGRAGQTAAGGVARDEAQASAVPGYAGTSLPQNDLTADGMEDAARRVLANPLTAGGRAGRAVIDGSVSRPAVEIPAGDPALGRGSRIMNNPQAPGYGAGGLASGSVTACGAGLGNGGGSCGGVTYCLGADCETVTSVANTGFADAATRLNMALELGGDEFDRGALRFFTGERRACRIRFGGLANCCRDSGLLVGIAGCREEEYELAQERHDGHTHYLGRFCTRRVLGACVQRERAWCVFGSKLGRIFQEQGRSQLGIGWGSCRGLTLGEVERIDFERVDLSEFTADLMDGASEPSVTLPDAGAVGTAMQNRVRDFYRNGR